MVFPSNLEYKDDLWLEKANLPVIYVEKGDQISGTKRKGAEQSCSAITGDKGRHGKT